MMQILKQRVVRSVINLIEQTQGADLPSVPQTKEFILTQPSSHCEQHYPAIIFQLGQNHALKQFLSARGQLNNIPARRMTPRLVAAFDTPSRK